MQLTTLIAALSTATTLVHSAAISVVVNNPNAGAVNSNNERRQLLGGAVTQPLHKAGDTLTITTQDLLDDAKTALKETPFIGPGQPVDDIFAIIDGANTAVDHVEDNIFDIIG